MNRLLEISRRSMLAFQQSMSVTSHNITNANNPNYSRQRVTLAAEELRDVGSGFYGTGVVIDDIHRVKNEIVENNIRLYTTNHGMAEKHANILSNIESIFTEPTDLGLSSLINGFFDSWDELSVDPTSSPMRSKVVQQAGKLTNKLTQMNDQFTQVKKDVRAEVEGIVTSINGLVKQLAEINKRIDENTTTDAAISDLLDERDAVVHELSQYANATVNVNDRNIASVSIGGVYAADLSYNAEFQATVIDGKIVVNTTTGSERLTLTGGHLGALTQAFEKDIPHYKNDLNELVEQIYHQVNDVHKKGYNLLEPPSNGIPFFSDYKDGMLFINPLIEEDNRYLATSADGNAGNNEIAVEIAELKNKAVFNNHSFSDKYGGLISELAAAIELDEKNTETYQLALNQLDIQKQSYSGVSVDEEWANLIRFQRSYDAAARLTNIADEMLQTVINMLR